MTFKKPRPGERSRPPGDQDETVETGDRPEAVEPASISEEEHLAEDVGTRPGHPDAPLPRGHRRGPTFATPPPPPD